MSADTISPTDRTGEIILAIAWAGSLYGIAMIACTTALIDRWRGPRGEKHMNFFSVVAAFILSVGWPVIFIYLAAQKR